MDTALIVTITLKYNESLISQSKSRNN